MMPTKEEDEMDNFMNNNNQPQSQTGSLSKAELRKSNKPIMEKKRRARINHCLNELKTLILEAMKKDPARHQKLEKADILEMTVKHLQTVQRSHLVMSVQTDPTVLQKFKSGFVDCAEEVNRVIASMENVDVPSKQRLLTHLNGCITGLQQVAPFQFGGTQFGSNNVSLNPPIHPAPQTISIPTQDVNNNSGRIQMGGVQFIPSRLPTGELALVMPNSTNLQYFPQSTFPQQQIDLNTNYQRPSAFNTVSKSGIRSHITSPPLSPISSISSCGEDSSSEFHPITQTPPLQQMNHHNFINTFPTPPSTNTSFKIPSSSLQQSHISSTTEIISQQFTGQIIKPEIHYVNKKRPYPVDLSEVVQRPAEKIVKLEVPVVHHLENQENHEQDQDNMWRPW